MKTGEAESSLRAVPSNVNSDYVLCEGDSSQWSVGITRATIERILKSDSEDRGDMLSLWMFYAYTCRWQEVSQARATVAFVAKGMGWSEPRVKKARNGLKELGLIDDVQSRAKDGQVNGWYVAVRHLAKASKIHPVENQPGGESHPKCLKTLNGNALGVSCDPKKKPKTDHEIFIDAWMRYYADRHKGLKYPFNGRDAKAVKELLAYFGDQKKLREFIKECHSRRGYPFDNLETLYEIHSNLARLVSALNPPSTNGFKKSESAAKREDRFEDPMAALVRKTLEEAK